SDDLNMVLNQANSGNVGQVSASGDSGSGTGSSAPERDEPGQSIFGPTGDLAEKAIQFGIDQVANLIGNVVGPHFNLPCAIACATSGGGSAPRAGSHPIGPQLPGAGEAFGPHDLVLGLDPDGPVRQLKTFQLEVGGGGGNRIVQIWNGMRDGEV